MVVFSHVRSLSKARHGEIAHRVAYGISWTLEFFEIQPRVLDAASAHASYLTSTSISLQQIIESTQMCPRCSTLIHSNLWNDSSLPTRRYSPS